MNVSPMITNPFAALSAAALLSAMVAESSAAETKLQFNRDIRPILSDTCFACHGPDAAKQKGGLRLDLRDAAMKGGKSEEPAIIPGNPDASEILVRILSQDPDEVMPPPKEHKKLKPEQVATLRRWVAEGAEYQGHWAFQKPVRPEIPAVAGLSPKANPVDAFIRARLAAEGLQAAPEAEKGTLLRRASLDLTGLPPTPAELDAFLQDPRPEAYEAAVDRLIASPRYGELMAMQWLDFARYADSNGFQSDTSREMWHWRDWLIGAFNRNQPFDAFTIDQLAGDLLPNPTPEQIVATGFHRNHRLNGEGGRIVEEWFAETVIDRVETTGLTWMGLTFNCCRCHDHKFDPISQKEFYQFFAFFNSCDETGVLGEFGGAAGSRKGGNTMPVLFLPTDAERQRKAVLEGAVKKAEQVLVSAKQGLPADLAAWEKGGAQKLAQLENPWVPFAAVSATSIGGAELIPQGDGSYLASGKNPANDTYEISGPIAAGTFTGLRLEVLPGQTETSQGLGRAANGNFVLSGVEVDIFSPGVSDPQVATFIRAEADYEQKGWEVGGVLKGQPKLVKGKRAKGAPSKAGWAVDGNDPAKRLPRKALFICEPIQVPEGATLSVRLVHGSPHTDHNIARFRLQTTSLRGDVVKLEGSKIPASLRQALAVAPALRSPDQRQEVERFFLANTDNPVRNADAALTEARKHLKDFTESQPSTMVMREAAQPRDAFVLKRGEYDKPGDKVPRGVPAALPPLPQGAPVNRLGLAQWLVSGEHPLTARIWVNRAWERFFGIGLVKTSENFGSQAEWPSHPELLDWLACEFMQPTVSPTVAGAPARPWDMKALLKLLVTSATYRQSAQVTPALLERDPDNRLVARGPRFRLSAELMRDQALALSGLLVEQLGGPSVHPYMPPAVWDETSVYGNLRNYKADTQPGGLYRRSLYTIWKRTAAPPSMLLFDTPNREICTVKRSRTNTPTQALALLNEVTYVEAARKLAERMLKEGGADSAQRITWAFRCVTSRTPNPPELLTLQKGLENRLIRFRQNTEAARELVAQGESKADPGFEVAELAAYTGTANVLLNLDEVVTRE
jgi:mono/diheme cytochrome c family protein